MVTDLLSVPNVFVLTAALGACFSGSAARWGVVRLGYQALLKWDIFTRGVGHGVSSSVCLGWEWGSIWDTDWSGALSFQL